MTSGALVPVERYEVEKGINKSGKELGRRRGTKSKPGGKRDDEREKYDNLFVVSEKVF